MTTRPWTLAIDFGTSYTVAAACAQGRSPEILEIDGARRVPSVVLVEDGRYVVGSVADDLAAAYPGRTLRAPKRRLGDTTPVVLDGRSYQVVDLVGALLRHVHDEAVHQYGSAPTEVRLTHPAVWLRPRLTKLLESAASAGIANPVLVPEPVAAALTYASEVGVPAGAHVAVYDLGGGTFDTAVVTPTESGFQVIGRPGGDPEIGGELFDELLFGHVGAQLDPTTWESIQYSDEPTWRRVNASMWAEIRRGKELLSGYPVADMLVSVPGGLVPVRVTRAEYEALIGSEIQVTVGLLERCVREAGSDAAHLAAIYLVGGASRTPLVAQMIEERFPTVPISRRGDPKTSTALGAVLAVRAGRPGVAAAASPTPPAPVTPTPPPAPPAGPPPVTQPHSPPATPPPVTQPDTPPAGLPVTAPTMVVVPPVNVPPPGQRRRAWPVVAFVLVLLAVAGAAVALVAIRQDDEAGSGPQPFAVDAGDFVCVRTDIDQAAVREEPDRAAPVVAFVAPGTCLRVGGGPAVDGGAWWVPVSAPGVDGHSVQANFVRPGEESPAELTVRRYYELAGADAPAEAWELLTAAHQATYGDFEAFAEVWARLRGVTISSFDGCEPDDLPTTCRLVVDFDNRLGGTSRFRVAQMLVDDRGILRIDSAAFEFVECVRNNDGADDCPSD